jgi:hypothetical protein
VRMESCCFSSPGRAVPASPRPGGPSRPISHRRSNASSSDTSVRCLRPRTWRGGNGWPSAPSPAPRDSRPMAGTCCWQATRWLPARYSRRRRHLASTSRCVSWTSTRSRSSAGYGAEAIPRNCCRATPRSRSGCAGTPKIPLTCPRCSRTTAGRRWIGRGRRGCPGGQGRVGTGLPPVR